MDPKQPLDLIASYAGQDLDELERMEAEARRERDREVRRTRRSLAAEPEALSRFEAALAGGREYVRLMEDHNHLMEQSTAGALREAVHWVGRRLVRNGLLDDTDDVLHFSMNELTAFADGTGPADLRALAAERQAEFERRSALRPPRTIGSGALPPVPRDLAKALEAPAGAGRDGSVILGVAASRGRATGRARVAQPSVPPPEVRKGDILVATNAGPSWTPIFPLLGGLVLDQGAVFQHAALVAREYRIPAVIMSKDATAEIRDGQTVTVDGDEGIVELDT
jgi:pyruvate,water dikinase